ncbi:hypothetical protein G7046_g4919 [Stylonectria norvegica]|nr:hypothetical protein G7046_g4919 [Stylonectria norvegica]
MSPTRSWLSLPIPSSADLPVLLVSVDIDTASYTVYLTDLANMWTESLDRKAICIRGWSENTSIDPSDTPENMAMFLTSLKAALDSSQPGHEKTSLDLSRSSEPSSGDDSLTLKIRCDLPGLQPLKWPMILKRSPPSAIATDLVLPLVQAHLTKTQELESLVRMLAQKDAVLNKLVDKLEAMGTGLEHVFNPLSGRKKVTRQAAADKVPGLAPFNHRQWKTDIADAEEGPNSIGALVNQVFGGEGLQYRNTMEIEDSPGLDQWWHEFSGISHAPARSQKYAVSEVKSPSPPPEQSMDTDGDDDDDFQVQQTPIHLALAESSATAKKEKPPNDNSTEDEITSPAPKRQSTSSEILSKPGTKKPTSRLGTLGRKKQSTPARSPSPVQIPSRKRASTPKADDSETASEADDDGATASLPDDEPPSSPPQLKIAPKKGVLGRIGGPKPKSKPSAKEDGKALQLDDGEDTKQPSRSPPPKKLGVIGKRKENDTALAKPTPDDDGGRGRAVTRQSQDIPPPETRETSQERADRKREELRKNLEKKAAAGPAKKKRKF